VDRLRKEVNRSLRIGVDTGGTFTDFVIYKDGKISIKKILSTPQNPSLAILEGIQELLNEISPPAVIHGTTVATNALLERKGGRIGLITTLGFEDILLIGRQTRRKLYSLKGEGRSPLLPRHHCFGLDERTLASGKIEKKVEASQIRKIVKKLMDLKIEAVAVSLIHSYANPANENIVLRELDKAHILSSVSSQILPEYREYERTATTAANAYLMPVMHLYLASLEEKLQNVDLRIMQSNEGVISPSKAKKEPIRTALSGPAGGVVGAFELAKEAGSRNIISFDMGGTSTDVSLIEGEIKRSNEILIGDFPVRIPIIDIHSVGAGGGSIALIDRGGSLRVGPESAGANPGPACYGKGEGPTVTDANLVLGRLDPDFFLGGKMKIFPERSFRAIENLARRIKKNPVETAQGIIEIANANMEKAIRVISIERGYDPRSFSLFSFGGAGGMHAVDLATQLRIPRVIVPRFAGVLSAFGLLLADSIKDYSKSVLKTADRMSRKDFERIFFELKQRSLEDLAEEGFGENEIDFYPHLDLRYLGQSYEITIPFRLSFIADFHRAHQKLYSYHHSQKPVEVVNLRLKAVGRTQKIKLKKYPETKASAQKALVRTQTMTCGPKEYRGAVYDRSLLEPGNKIKGPSLVIDSESTTFLPPGFAAWVDGFLNLIIEKG
jgi:N-methylhydantoinase A/oxoprolinase/acetone carboxylase beta subunit